MAEEKKEEPKKEAETEGEAGKEAAPKSKKKLIIIGAAALLVLILGGGAAFFFLVKGHKTAAPAADSAEKDTGKEAKPKEEKTEEGKADEKKATDSRRGKKTTDGKEGKEGAAGAKENAAGSNFVDLQEFLVNLNTGGKQTSFLKLVVTLDAPDDDAKAAVEANMPRIRDSFQVYLRELRAEDLRGSAGLQLLREELLLRINKIISPAKVNDILFKEIIVQ